MLVLGCPGLERSCLEYALFKSSLNASAFCACDPGGLHNVQRYV